MERLVEECFWNKLFMKCKLVIKYDIYMVHLKDKAKIDTRLVWLWNIVEGKENNFVS